MKAVASQSLGAENSRTYADFTQSPRYPEAVHPAPRGATKAHEVAGWNLPPTTCDHTNAAEYSRKTVAESDSGQSQVRVLGATVALVVALVLLLVSTAEAKCRTHACWHRVHVKRQHHWIHSHIWAYRWHHIDSRLKLALARLRFCESRNNYRAVNGQYTGGYQYGPNAAARAGFRGAAMYASPREQDVRTAWFFPAHAGEWECRA